MTFQNHRIVDLQPKLIAACEAFADLRIENGDSYSDSYQGDKIKNKKDILVGALGEVALRRFLGPACSLPDFTYYGKEDKSYSSDMMYKGHKIAVKTQWSDAARRFGLSWTFQLATSSRREDPIVSNPSGFIALCLAHEAGQAVTVQALLRATDIIPEFLEPPKLAKLKDVKTCLYWSTLSLVISAGSLKDYADEL